MTPGEKNRTLDGIRDCLRNYPEAESLPGDWEKYLIEAHREHINRDAALGRGVPCEFGRKPGWVTVEQGGGGIFVHLWSLEAQKNPEARAAMQNLEGCLAAVLHLSKVWLRLTTPHEIHRRKGWQLLNGN